MEPILTVEQEVAAERKHGRTTLLYEIGDLLTTEQMETAYRRMAELEEKELFGHVLRDSLAKALEDISSKN